MRSSIILLTVGIELESSGRREEVVKEGTREGTESHAPRSIQSTVQVQYYFLYSWLA